MEIGAIYPQIELRGDPQALHDIARAVEDLGYECLVMFDHVAGAQPSDRNPPLFGPYTDQDPFHDPFVAFGYLAAVTRRLQLVTGVMVLPQRQTLLAARQAADVDLLTGGRLRLGVGVGWNPVEFQGMGQDFHTRGARIEEQIGLLRRLWDEPLISFEGRFHTIDRMALNPRPRRRIPIYGGGISTPAYKRAARLADGFVFSGDLESIVLPGWQEVRGFLAEQGRALEGFGADFLLPMGADVQTVLDWVRRWEDVGGSSVSIRTMDLGFTTAQQHIDYLADVRQRLG